MNESNSPKQKTFSCGACNIDNFSPKLEALSAATKKLNVRITFEEALKLHLAIGECVRRLNLHNRATKAGKRTALNLTIHLSDGCVTVSQWP